jgi:hypothetical protein
MFSHAKDGKRPTKRVLMADLGSDALVKAITERMISRRTSLDIADSMIPADVHGHRWPEIDRPTVHPAPLTAE